jgi:hypothetical protein
VEVVLAFVGTGILFKGFITLILHSGSEEEEDKAGVRSAVRYYRYWGQGAAPALLAVLAALGCWLAYRLALA